MSAIVDRLNEAGALTFEVDGLVGEAKLRELILYISAKLADDPGFGATRLNKVLFYSDFMAYIHCGKPITGVAYQRLARGPAPRRLLPVRTSMIDDGELDLLAVRYFGKAQHRTLPLRDARTDLFTDHELKIVDAIISNFRGMNAVAVSEFSHGLAWKTAHDGELIPYQAAFLSDEPPTKADIAWAGRVAGELGLNA